MARQKRIAAHHRVLSVTFDYFTTMFTNDVKEPKLEEVKMKKVDAEDSWVLNVYIGEYFYSLLFVFEPTTILCWFFNIFFKSFHYHKFNDFLR